MSWLLKSTTESPTPSSCFQREKQKGSRQLRSSWSPPQPALCGARWVAWLDWAAHWLVWLMPPSWSSRQSSGMASTSTEADLRFAPNRCLSIKWGTSIFWRWSLLVIFRFKLSSRAYSCFILVMAQMMRKEVERLILNLFAVILGIARVLSLIRGLVSAGLNWNSCIPLYSRFEALCWCRRWFHSRTTYGWH